MMMSASPATKGALLAIALTAIVVSIFYLEGQRLRTESGSPTDSMGLGVSVPSPEKQRKMFPEAKEIAEPSGFLNAEPFTLEEHIGKEVILVDFWTYSCINCQRTFPYLNAWWDKYKDSGLLIVGVHTPEFEFEKDIDNVRRAVVKFGISYPVVLDNDYATWRAYGNRYWPRKYLIDIDGYIVYDHIGEGGYEETERRIQELLKERMERLGGTRELAGGIVSPKSAETAAGLLPRTPEIYFGALRNEYLANGARGTVGAQTFIAERDPNANLFGLDGGWNVTGEYAENVTRNARIVLHYRARKVFMVAGTSNGQVRARLLLDGEPLGERAGEDVASDGTVLIGPEMLYRLIEDSAYGDHVLEIIIEEPGVRAFTFTFG